jgi:hypothetical protein
MRAQGVRLLTHIFPINNLPQVYEDYEKKRSKQIENYTTFHGPVRNSTVCRALGFRRFFGRKGFIFCTEGCTHFSRKAGDPAPQFEEQDFEDAWDASTVLMKVLGPPPANVVVKRWRYDPEKCENFLQTFPEGTEGDSDLKAHAS